MRLGLKISKGLTVVKGVWGGRVGVVCLSFRFLCCFGAVRAPGLRISTCMSPVAIREVYPIPG